jgi:glycerol-3-phosphate acyltransferase PlsY
MFPVWLRFRGGKGVATGLGAFLPLAPAAGGVAVLVFAGVLALSRYVSLASILGALSLAGTTHFLGLPAATVACAWAAALTIVARHGANVARLRAGTESRLGRKPAAQSAPGAPS